MSGQERVLSRMCERTHRDACSVTMASEHVVLYITDSGIILSNALIHIVNILRKKYFMIYYFCEKELYIYSYSRWEPPLNSHNPTRFEKYKHFQA